MKHTTLAIIVGIGIALIAFSFGYVAPPEGMNPAVFTASIGIGMLAGSLVKTIVDYM